MTAFFNYIRDILSGGSILGTSWCYCPIRRTFVRRNAAVSCGEAESPRAAASAAETLARPVAGRFTVERGCSRVRVVRYGSLIELAEQMAARNSSGMTPPAQCVLILHPHFSGDLPSLIRRSHSVGSLIVAVPSGKLSGVIDRDDPDTIDGGPSWENIVLCPTAEIAVARMVRTLTPGDEGLVYAPAWGVI